jgi:hypothetical protein
MYLATSRGVTLITKAKEAVPHSQSLLGWHSQFAGCPVYLMRWICLQLASQLWTADTGTYCSGICLVQWQDQLVAFHTFVMQAISGVLTTLANRLPLLRAAPLLKCRQCQ